MCNICDTAVALAAVLVSHGAEEWERQKVNLISPHLRNV